MCRYTMSKHPVLEEEMNAYRYTMSEQSKDNGPHLPRALVGGRLSQRRGRRHRRQVQRRHGPVQ